uniref:Cytochrome c oxidase subunit 2 n=1 Tax=Rhagophthalminae sp. GENSP01 TaxID=1205577 RepID=A0A0S2MNW6_9COLE|nr:cytochrome c oxidase subunit 2 [Rhagophthalminae sp. GENSP01]
MSTWLNFNSQDSISPIMEQLIFFHDHSMMIMITIIMIVLYILISIFKNNKINRFIMKNQLIEILWTIVPTFTLIFIAIPSIKILYMMDEINSPMISIKSIGHQWFWSYEMSDFKNIEFDSFLNSNKKMNFSFRLLDVDNRLYLPMNSLIRMMISSSDVIHSWTIPSAGVKIDATPGRLNQTSFLLNRPGLMFGQCSEICGSNHSFMPIVIESILPKYFIKWIKNF